MCNSELANISHFYFKRVFNSRVERRDAACGWGCALRVDRKIRGGAGAGATCVAWWAATVGPCQLAVGARCGPLRVGQKKVKEI